MMSPSSFEPTWESLSRYQVPRWYENAKLGIFIHWGLYSVPAFDNEWYSRNMYLKDSVAYQHHRAVYGDQTVFGYKDFIPMFKGEHFDPAAWMALFKAAGARYVVPVAQHHDGFAMYNSAYTSWNAVCMGPRRDVIAALKQAADTHGLRFGVSNHHAENWWFFDGGRKFPSDVQDPANAGLYGHAAPSPVDFGFSSAEWNSNDWQPRPTREFLENWLARCCELVDTFAPDVFYFDWWIRQQVFEPYLQRFAAYYYNRVGTDAVLNYKNDAFPDGTAVLDIERGRLTGIRTSHWQTDTSLGYKSWCHIENEDFKQPQTLVHLLADIVSKNGNLLINVGPKADGTIPAESESLLRALGAWLAVNGEAIYGSRCWHIYGEGDTAHAEGEKREQDDQPYTAQDIRFTLNNGALYAICLGWPESAARIISLGRASGVNITRVDMLGSAPPLAWQQRDDALYIDMPEHRPCDHAVTFKITMR